MHDLYPRLRLLSSSTQLLTKRDLLNLVFQGIKDRQVVFGHNNLHGAALVQRLPALQQFLNSTDYVYMDGMPFVWLARLCGFPACRIHRNTGLDWIPDLLEQLDHAQCTIFFIGGNSETAEKIQSHLAGAYRRMQIFVHHGYLSAEQSVQVVDLINTIQPDLLLLGMGMPRQELWLQENRERLRFGVALPAGAILEYYVGAQKPPSRHSGRLGLEWLVRLWNEPRRLGHRYLMEPWSLLLCGLRDIWHYRIGSGRGEVRRFRTEFANAVSGHYKSDIKPENG